MHICVCIYVYMYLYINTCVQENKWVNTKIAVRVPQRSSCAPAGAVDQLDSLRNGADEHMLAGLYHS